MHLIMHVYTHRCTWNCPHGFAVHDLVSPVSYFASPVLFSSSVIQFFHGIGWEGTPQGWSMLCVWLLVALLQHPWVSNYAVIRQHQIEWHQHAHPEKSLSKDFLAIWSICINLPTSSKIFSAGLDGILLSIIATFAPFFLQRSSPPFPMPRATGIPPKGDERFMARLGPWVPWFS